MRWWTKVDKGFVAVDGEEFRIWYEVFGSPQRRSCINTFATFYLSMVLNLKVLCMTHYTRLGAGIAFDKDNMVRGVCVVYGKRGRRVGLCHGDSRGILALAKSLGLHNVMSPVRLSDDYDRWFSTSSGTRYYAYSRDRLGW